MLIAEVADGWISCCASNEIIGEHTLKAEALLHQILSLNVLQLTQKFLLLDVQLVLEFGVLLTLLLMLSGC